MKKTITLTLDAYDAQVFEKAVRIACRLHGAGDAATGTHRRFVLRWLIGAGCSAIIRKGEMPAQLAVELRHETPEETRQRISREVPQPMDSQGARPDRRTSEAAMNAVAQNILGKYYKPQLPDVQCVLADLLRFSTANWDKLEPLWLAQVGYALDEGWHPRELWASKVRAQLKRQRRI